MNAQDAWYVVAYCRRAAASGPSASTASAAPCLLDEQFARRARDRSPGPYMPWGARPQPGEHRRPERIRVVHPGLARWMLEKHGSRERFADGSVLVEIPYASEEWLVKELLKYQGEAVLFEPVALRRTVADLAEEVLGAYGADRPSGGRRRRAPPASPPPQPRRPRPPGRLGALGELGARTGLGQGGRQARHRLLQAPRSSSPRPRL